jgi:glycosyltransferase involved in cell wall biosynthesis
MAFGSSTDDAVLVFKASSTAQAPLEIKRLKKEAEGLNVVWIADVLSRADTLALMKSLDVYVSLHRSEGFGLTMAEAMAMGKPVIATGYSGNVDFMDQHNSCLVRSQALKTEEAFGAYPCGTVWSDPDAEHAAEYMRALIKAERREEIGVRAARSIRQRLAPDIVGRLVSDLLSIDNGLPPRETKGVSGVARRATSATEP